jgi:ABC-type amino acid transport substrate-binding protein
MVRIVVAVAGLAALLAAAPAGGGAQAPDRYGPLAGRITTGERYAAVLPEGSRLAGPVNRALQGLVRDGTVARLQRRWLTANVAALPVLQ